MKRNLLLFTGTRDDLLKLTRGSYFSFKQHRIIEFNPNLMIIQSDLNEALFKRLVTCASKKFPDISFDLINKSYETTKFKSGKVINKNEEHLINIVAERMTINV